MGDSHKNVSKMPSGYLPGGIPAPCLSVIVADWRPAVSQPAIGDCGRYFRGEAVS